MSAAAPESPIWLEINGRRRTCWSCTPEQIEELVLGLLLGSGYLDAAEDLLGLERHDQPPGCIGVRVIVPEENASRVALERRHTREHGCGLLHTVLCDTASIRRPRRATLPDPDALRAAFRTLFTQTDAAHPEGGMHAAAIWADGVLRDPVFDVGRHNTVDRALGRALAARIPLDSAGLLLSARVSGAMALRAARAGIGFLASRSIATGLAEQIAAAAGLPIIARAGARSERRDG
jgi:FdhD protein